MSTYWNKIILKKLFQKKGNTQVKYKLSTKIGRFYFYFEKKDECQDKSNILGKVVFFPKKMG